MKNFIPGTRPEWGRELPDEDDNSLVDKRGNNYDNKYNFDERNDEDEAEEEPQFDPEAAKRRYEAAKKAQAEQDK